MSSVNVRCGRAMPVTVAELLPETWFVVVTVGSPAVIDAETVPLRDAVAEGVSPESVHVASEDGDWLRERSVRDRVTLASEHDVDFVREWPWVGVVDMENRFVCVAVPSAVMVAMVRERLPVKVVVGAPTVLLAVLLRLAVAVLARVRLLEGDGDVLSVPSEVGDADSVGVEVRDGVPVGEAPVKDSVSVRSFVGMGCVRDSLESSVTERVAVPVGVTVSSGDVMKK
jgi:hypothetical protein